MASISIGAHAGIISNETLLVFQWIAYCAVCQVINVLGIISNIINIACFIKQGFKESVNVSLLGMYCRPFNLGNSNQNVRMEILPDSVASFQMCSAQTSLQIDSRTERQLYRQTYILVDGKESKQTVRYMDRQDRQTGWQTECQIDRKSKHTNIHTADAKIYRQIGRQTDKFIYTQ